MGSLAWVVLRSTAACQEGRPTKRSAKTRGGSETVFSGGRGGNPIAANSPEGVSREFKESPKPGDGLDLHFAAPPRANARRTGRAYPAKHPPIHPLGWG